MINIIKNVFKYLLKFIIMFLVMYLLIYITLLYITINRNQETYHVIHGMATISGILFGLIGSLLLHLTLKENKKIKEQIEKENNMTDLEKKQKEYDIHYNKRAKLKRSREEYMEEIEILNFDIDFYDKYLLKLSNEIKELQSDT